MGTPDFAVPSLRATASSCDVAAVVTRPDRPRGRGQKLAASEVAVEAERLGLPVWKAERVNAAECRERIAAVAPDLLAVVAFGAILSPATLAIPRLGCINLHGSLLPDYRGASPVARALWDGRVSTGVTTMWMDDGVDTGDQILQRWIPIEPADNAGTLSARLADLGGPLLADSLVLAGQGQAPRIPQDRAAGSYAPKLEKRDGSVDWAQDAESVWCRQRAVTPWPGAHTMFREHRLKLMETRPVHRLRVDAAPGLVLEIDDEGIVVACDPGALCVLRVRPEGKADMFATEWARARAHRAGRRPAHRKEAHA